MATPAAASALRRCCFSLLVFRSLAFVACDKGDSCRRSGAATLLFLVPCRVSVQFRCLVGGNGCDSCRRLGAATLSHCVACVPVLPFRFC
ncbi:hypothetical protein IW261DRAFT_1445091 [Armillaria novae-zelandiae]|uniref:Secreted protein n=1 Tax=Armillaria novae-zelandiae TaxID=153914 RepID=A0AA39THQ8_9AGAR|nr:hypothetical protein IW261DRAFT_1477426 [Armillaria novae-zelandiae]KAK0489446.1 hypothetical protein IW261DRAFT_1445091 [Armillaria novae-zelandiae]